MQFIPIPANWRESYKGKVYGPSTLLRLCYVFVMVVALACFCFGILYYGTRTVQEFEISSVELPGEDGWECSSIASRTITTPLLNGIGAYVVENEGIAQVLPESYRAKMVNLDENDLDTALKKKMMANIDYHPTIEEKEQMLPDGNSEYWNGLQFIDHDGIFNIFPLSTGYFADIGSPLESAALGEWKPEALSTMTLDTLQAPTVEECVDALVEHACALDDEYVVDTNDNVKLYRFTLPTMASFATCNASYYNESDKVRDAIGLFEYSWHVDWPCRYSVGFNNLSDDYTEFSDNYFWGVDGQYDYIGQWGAPLLSLANADTPLRDMGLPNGDYGPYTRWWLYHSNLVMSDQVVAWYVLVEHHDDSGSVCDNLGNVYKVHVNMVNQRGYPVAGWAESSELICEEIDTNWCIVDATNQMVAEQGDISLGTTISKTDEFQTRLYLALSDVHGQECSDRWENVCKAHNNFEDICQSANIAPYKCERSVSLGLLSTLSLSWSAMQLVLAAMLFAFGVFFGKCCKARNEDGNEDEMTETEMVMAGASAGNGNTGGDGAEEDKEEKIV